MFAPRLDPLINNLCFNFAKTEIKSECVFTVILKNCQFRFCHNFTVLLDR